MYKILHIPTAQLLHDFKTDLPCYIDKNDINAGDIWLDLGASDNFMFPIYFKTKQLALDYLKYYSHYTMWNTGTEIRLILIVAGPDSYDEDEFPINISHFEIIEV